MPARRPDAVAFDSASVRRVDQDGRLHVETSNISKANVCGYLGREIPNWEMLGLDADRIYQLYRDPAELAKAAPTFNNIPVLCRHVPVTADDHQPELVVGSTGTDAEFSDPHLKNSLVVWEAGAIAGIETGQQRELSAAYRYDADMVAGEVDGTPYDGVMRNIRGNHVALVEVGRAGSDVVVGDEALPLNQSEKLTMAKKPLTRTVLLAGVAIKSMLGPKLAEDARPKFDFRGLVEGVESGGKGLKWPAIKAGLAKTLPVDLKGKMAQDADITDVVEMLDQLDDVVEEMDAAGALEEDPERDPAAMDSDPAEAALTFLSGLLQPTDLAAVREILKPSAAADADPDDDGKKDDEDDGKKAGKKDKEKDDDKMVSKTAMDAALAKVQADATEAGRKAAIATMLAVREAEKVVRPWIGELAIAQDSAEAVYRLALDSIGVKHEGVHPSAYRAILEAHPKPGERPKAPDLALDAAAVSGFAARFPDAARINTV